MTLQFMTNPFAALGMGTMIGRERQWRQHRAGLRTNALVSLGAAMFVGFSVLMPHDASPTRIAAQVVSGLGFLGGGVILREGLNIKGLNTAATSGVVAPSDRFVGRDSLAKPWPEPPMPHGYAI